VVIWRVASGGKAKAGGSETRPYGPEKSGALVRDQALGLGSQGGQEGARVAAGAAVVVDTASA
jgi:hypothetical protein